MFTLFILLFYFYPIYLILLVFSLNLCLCFINRHLENIFGQILIFSVKKLFATCITKARIAIITATIQFMHLILAQGCCKQSYTYFVTFNSKLALICYTSCKFAFILVKHVHTLVKLCVAKQKVRLLTILDFFSIVFSNSSQL